MCTQHLFDEESEFIITGSYSEENCGTGDSLSVGGKGVVDNLGELSQNL